MCIFDGMLSFFSAFLANFPRLATRVPHPKDWIRRGDLHLRRAELNDALKCYRKAARISSGSIEIWKKEGIILGMMGRYMEAIVAFDQAAKVNPIDFQVWMHHGFTLWRLERWREARCCFERAIAVEPEDEYARYCREVSQEELVKVGIKP